MKKILTLFAILLLVSSCGKSDEELLGLTPRDEEITTEDNTVQDNPQSNTGSVSASGTIQEENKEEIKEEKKATNNKELVMINHNVFLREPGKEDEVLTTRAKGKRIEDCTFGDKLYRYVILSNKGNFGFVKRFYYLCGMDAEQISYYIINLENSDNTLTEITSKLPGELGDRFFPVYKEKIVGSEIVFSIQKSGDNFACKEEQCYQIDDIKKIGFQDEGDYLDFKVDLSKIIPTTNTSRVVETSSSLPEKYQHKTLMNEGYSLNKLGDIKEYYKKDGTGVGGTSWITVYVKGDKTLYIHTSYKFAVGEIYIADGKETYLLDHDETFDGTGIQFPIQPIFKEESDSILIVDTNLNTVTAKDKKSGETKVIWTR